MMPIFKQWKDGVLVAPTSSASMCDDKHIMLIEHTQMKFSCPTSPLGVGGAARRIRRGSPIPFEIESQADVLTLACGCGYVALANHGASDTFLLRIPHLSR
ncbi:hypothetical protein TNCV_1347381 [Trichonephila clavipes]|nr:hypothetical protein TNCV_1347381 [Trichonephila clavipes]